MHRVVDRKARDGAISKQVRVDWLPQSLAGARDNANVDGIVGHRGPYIDSHSASLEAPVREARNAAISVR